MLNAMTAKRAAKQTTPVMSHSWYTMWMGWDDFANGRPFSKEYETLNMAGQRNYERGRQAAASFKGTLGFVPRWKRNQLFRNVLNNIVVKYGVEVYEPAKLNFGYFNKDRHLPSATV